MSRGACETDGRACVTDRHGEARVAGVLGEQGLVAGAG